MMERSINGEIPNLKVDQRIHERFSKTQIVYIYEDMSKMILEALINKMQEKVKKYSGFDASRNDSFREVIKELNIFDRKIEFFKAKGFRQEWGCPNEVIL